MNFLTGIQNFLLIVSQNWVTICVICGLIVSLIQKIKSYIGKTDEEKAAIAKKQIQQTMLKMITEAEINYDAWNEAGSIKRSQVIEEIYEKYPILSKMANQEDVISWIDTEINNSLKTLREIVKSNKDKEVMGA